MRWDRVVEIMRKEFRQSFRDPRLRVSMFVPPVLQFLVFGFVVNMDVERSRLAWLDLDRSPASRKLRASFDGSRHFLLTATPGDEKEMQSLLDRWEVHSAVVVPAGFGRDLARGQTAQVQVLVDGSNSNTAAILANYSAEIIRSYANSHLVRIVNQKRMARGGQLAHIQAPEVELEQRVWFNPELKSRNYLIPGVAANIITIVTLMLTSLAIVREKELGTMEQLMVTPIRPMELMIGKTLPFAIVGLIDLVMIVVLGMAVFGIPFRGNALLLLAGSVVFLLSTLGAGLFLSTISNTQQQAIMSTFFFFLPAFTLSGFAFPISSMPEPVQYLTLLNPIRYFLEICRGVFLKGSGIGTLWPQLATLTVFGAAILFFSARRFRKRLE
jgi:ABC-2 type transport system permease protein